MYEESNCTIIFDPPDLTLGDMERLNQIRHGLIHVIQILSNLGYSEFEALGGISKGTELSHVLLWHSNGKS